MSCDKIVRSPFGFVHIPDNESLPDHILHRAQGWEDKIALVQAETEECITYKEFAENIRCMASVLTRWRLQKGDRALIYSPNVINYCAAILGVAYAGGITATANPNYTPDELRYMIDDSEPVYIFTTESLLPRVRTALEGYTKIKGIILLRGSAQGCHDYNDLIKSGDADFVTSVKFDPRNDVVFLPYSSGTTGRSKGVMMTHYNLMSTIKQFRCSDITQVNYSGETMILFLPLYHIYALGVLAGQSFSQGFKLIVMETFNFDLFLSIIEKYKVTVVPLVPPVALLMAKDPRTKEVDMSSVHDFLSGAAPLGGEIEQAVLKATGVGRFRQGFGMTETPCSSINPISKPKAGTSGVPLPNVEYKVVDVGTREALGPNENGELLVRGPQVMKGYWQRPEATAETFTKDGWLLTGDIAQYDEDGYFMVVDRLKELIKWKGLQVPPADLEDTILKHPGVSDVAVIGIPDEEAGELPRAYVVIKQGVKVTEKDIVDFVSKRVSPHKRLRGGVVFLDEIPKSASGKILRRVLKETIKHKSK